MNQKTNHTIKVIGGVLKGQRLFMPTSQNTRSSKSILKESLFNTLQTNIVQYSFIEIFAGTGSIGIEAISRGAKQAIFLEKDSQAFKILKKNITFIEKRFPDLKTTLLLGDSFELLPTILQNYTQESLILFFDPPFPIRKNYTQIYEQCFKMIENFHSKQQILIIFEHFSIYKMPQIIKDFSIIKTKKFGKSSLSYYSNQ